MELSSQQKKAIALCVNPDQRIAPVTGPAGTGKTTIMRQVYTLLTEAGYKVSLAAPTGKAAKRIQEATNLPASTLHRLLEYGMPSEDETGRNLDDSLPRRDKKHPLECDVVLVDEYMMVAHELHRNLIDAIPRGGRLCCFGDVNQLRPVEVNRKIAELPPPFLTLLDKFNGVELDVVHRTAGDSGVLAAAQNILRGLMPKRGAIGEQFYINFAAHPVNALTELVLQMSEEYGIEFNTVDAQIITTQKNSWIGTHKLNRMLQNIFRTEADGWVELPRHTYDAKDVETLRVREGDKILITKNNYTEGREMFNGETGIITEVSGDYGEVVVDLGDRTVVVPPVEIRTRRDTNAEYEYDPRKDIDLAYAITTHKAQGSEWKHVIYTMNKSTQFMQCRRNFYTAVTRAREAVIVITDQQSLARSVQRKEQANFGGK